MRQHGEFPKKAAPQPTLVQSRPHVEAMMASAAAVEFAAPPAVELPPALELAPAPAPVVPNIVAAPEAAKAIEAPLASMQEFQNKTRSLVEKSLVESRANYTKAKSAANEASSAIEASYGAAKSGVVAFNVKAIEAIKASADANFDFFRSLASAKSMTELVSLQSEFARKQFETAFAQAKDLGALARKVADESTAPIKAQVSKAFKVAV